MLIPSPSPSVKQLSQSFQEWVSCLWIFVLCSQLTHLGHSPGEVVLDKNPWLSSASSYLPDALTAISSLLCACQTRGVLSPILRGWT